MINLFAFQEKYKSSQRGLTFDELVSCKVLHPFSTIFFDFSTKFFYFSTFINDLFSFVSILILIS